MLTRKTPLRRTPWVRRNRIQASRRRRAGGPTKTVVTVVLARSCRDGRPCCEVCGQPLSGERGYDWSLHHRRGRDGSAGEHDAANLLAVCGGSNVDRCHGRIHAGRPAAETNGWSISRNSPADPLTVALVVDNGKRRVLFTADGGYLEQPPPMLPA